MSVRFNGTSDTLRATMTALTVSTGSIQVLFWAKLISDLNAESDLVTIGDQVNPTSANRVGLTTDTDGLDLLGWPGGSGPLTLATGTWYGFVLGRELATTYHVYSGTTADFTPDAGHFIGAVDLPDFGAPHGVLTFTTPNPAKGTYYKVCAVNAAGQSSCGVAGPTAVALVKTQPTSMIWGIGVAAALAGLGSWAWLKRRR